MEPVSVAGVSGASSPGVDPNVQALIQCHKDTMDRLDNLLGFMAQGCNSANQAYRYRRPKHDQPGARVGPDPPYNPGRYGGQDSHRGQKGSCYFCGATRHYKRDCDQWKARQQGSSGNDVPSQRTCMSNHPNK